MAKSRLTPDYIEWVMSLNANQALREIHKVNEESKELSRQQNAARQAMVKLAALWHGFLVMAACMGVYLLGGLLPILPEEQRRYNERRRREIEEWQKEYDIWKKDNPGNYDYTPPKQKDDIFGNI